MYMHHYINFSYLYNIFNASGLYKLLIYIVLEIDIVNQPGPVESVKAYSHHKAAHLP